MYFYVFAESVIMKISTERDRRDFVLLFIENLTRKIEYLAKKCYIFYGNERLQATSRCKIIATS